MGGNDFDEEWNEVKADGWWRIHWSKLWKFFRWFINLFLIAIPWTIIDVACVIWNIYFNIEWNRYWAGGNMYLFYNTLFLMFQGFNSFFVVAEMPVYLRHFKTMRMLSFDAAVLWTIIYVISVADLVYIVFYKDKDDEDFLLLF